MGYILPVTKYEYTDYQRRVLKDQQDSHPIEKPYKVFLDMDQKSDYDRKFQEEMIKNKQYISHKSSPTLKRTKSDALDAEITGKGSLFNERV